MRASLFPIALLLSAFAPAPHAGTVEPGTGACIAALGCQVVRPGFFDCDNSSIAEALTRTPLVEVRVVAGVSSENVAIADRNLNLVGGYASCQAARDGTLGAADAFTLINAGGSGNPAVDISASTASPRRVVLSRVHVTGTSGAAQGALRVAGLTGQGRSSPLQVELRTVRVFDNAATLGGGLYLRDAQLTMFDSRIEGNEAFQDGGGAYCLRGTLRLATTYSGITGNTATDDGGGIHADDCEIRTLAGGGEWTPTGAPAGIRNNTATLGSGGGIHLRGGSYLEAGPSHDPGGTSAVISGNRANVLDVGGGRGGGGLFLTGAGTRANISNTRLWNNRAGSETPAAGAPDSVGGGIAAIAGATLQLVRVGGPHQCADVGAGVYAAMCTSLAFNVASGPGGAIYANNASVAIEGALIELNASRAATVEFSGSGAKFLDTSVLRNNGARDPVRTLQHVVSVPSGSALLRFLTFQANRAHHVSMIGQGLADVQIRAVIVDDDRGVAAVPALSYDASAAPLVRCLQAHETASLPAGAQRSFVGQQRWTAEQLAIGDYHLRGDAPFSDGVDACTVADADVGTGLPPDADGEVRALDAPAGDIAGPAPLDVGIDEYVPIALFSDGFE